MGCFREETDMLAVLQLDTPPKRTFWRRRRARRKNSVRAQVVPVGTGGYLQITAVPDREGRIDWDEVRQAAGREAGRMLFPAGVRPPGGYGFGSFSGHALSRALMAAAAQQLLRMASVPPKHMSIGLYDPSGSLATLVPALLPFAADVRVVTGRPQAYEGAERIAMAMFGAALPVTREAETLTGAKLILAPEGLGHIRPRARGLVLSGVPDDRPGVVGGYVPQVPPQWLQNAPDRCDIWRFLAGLYEVSGLREIAAEPPRLLYVGGHTFSLRDAAWKLAGLDIGISV